MTSASFRSSNCRSQGAVGDRSAAIRRANTPGAKYPRLLCGRSSLYSSLHAAIFTRASNKLPNQLAFDFEDFEGQTGRFLIFFWLRAQNPFNRPNSRSTLIFDHSLQNT